MLLTLKACSINFKKLTLEFSKYLFALAAYSFLILEFFKTAEEKAHQTSFRFIFLRLLE